ncbi:MAG: lipoate--protein ligase family protein [Spirochaetales bacterium]|nr:lipoate--protein ligase family protein [Spirochaetales bacterium]
MKKWRFLNSGKQSGSMNMAYDLATLQLLSNGLSSPMFRLYQWDKPTVTAGYFQNIFDEVNVSASYDAGVEIIKRATGGGAVYHNKEISYSLVFPVDHQLVAKKDTSEIFKAVCRPIMDTIESYGPLTTFRPMNDIYINGKKISGNAQKIQGAAILQHGTIILDLDDATMERFLLKPKSSVTSLRQQIGDLVLTSEFYNDFQYRLKKNFSRYFRINFVDKGFSDEEINLATKLASKDFKPLDETSLKKLATAGL